MPDYFVPSMSNMGMNVNYNFLPPSNPQYLFPNTSEMMNMNGQDTFFNPIPMEYGFMNGFPQAFVAQQSPFTPSPDLFSQNMLYGNNNMMMPNNMALTGINKTNCKDKKN